MALDRSIPFFNTILRCDDYRLREYTLPSGYRIAPYQAGNESAWVRLECAVGDFDSTDEAAEYFTEKYLANGNRDDILFLYNKAECIVGSCIAWTDERHGKLVNSLHWLIVDEAEQGKGLGRCLSVAVMNRFFERDGRPVYIHTQPWSWKAILLYSSLGFRLQESDSFGGYVNQYEDALKTLKGILTEEQYNALASNRV